MLRLVCLLLALSGAAFGEEAIRQEGGASFYGAKHDGAATASGEKLDKRKNTAASPDLPLGSHATVTNQDNGKSVDVKINDRGPFVGGRVIDLSEAAARQLDVEKVGVAPVTVEEKPSAQPTEELKAKVGEKAARRER